TSRPNSLRLVLIGIGITAALNIALVRFLQNALSFQGWQAQLYALAFAAALTLLGFSIVLPFRAKQTLRNPARRRAILVTSAVVLAVTAVALPTVIAGGDWNGVLQSTFT